MFTYRGMYRHAHFLTQWYQPATYFLRLACVCFLSQFGLNEGLPRLSESLLQFKDPSDQSQHDPPPTPHTHLHTQASHSFPDCLMKHESVGWPMTEAALSGFGAESRLNQKLIGSLSDTEFVLHTSGGKSIHILYFNNSSNTTVTKYK